LERLLVTGKIDLEMVKSETDAFRQFKSLSVDKVAYSLRLKDREHLPTINQRDNSKIRMTHLAHNALHKEVKQKEKEYTT